MRIGLLGASAIAPNAVVGPAAKRDGVTITAIAARDPKRARIFADRHGIAGVAEDYAALVERDDVDLVYCALPAALHAEWCEAALANGKMVLVEKPYALDAGHARRIAAAECSARRPVIEALHYRFHSQFQRACDLVASGTIGEVVAASATFNATVPYRAGELRWNAACGGGAVRDLGCYPIHALRSLLGCEPIVLEASAEFRDGVDASLSARFAFGSIAATIACSMTADPEQSLQLTGSKGRMLLSGFVAPHEGGLLTLTTAAGTITEPATGPTTYEAQLEHVVRVFRDEEAPRTGGADAIANMTVIDACRDSAVSRDRVRRAR